jgi:hypothetical protein
MALSANTTGDNNTAIGFQAMNANKTGYWNTANGAQALSANISGERNSADGAHALFSNTTGYANTANGTQALNDNTSGYYNTASGVSALMRNIDGYHNTANGHTALFSNTSGYKNTAIGRQALYSNNGGYGNTAIGHSAGSAQTNGNNNIYIGSNVPGVAGESNVIRIGNGQTTAYIAGTVNAAGIVTSGGVKFPDGSVQNSAKSDCMGRYEDNGNGTVTDCRTGLIWLKNANCTESFGGIDKSGSSTWYDAVTWVAALADTRCGLTDGSYAGDWRLPTKTEWMAMVTSAQKQGFTIPTLTNRAGTAKWSPGDIFDNVLASSWYWSSTDSAYYTDGVWIVALWNGSMSSGVKPYDGGYVWPVRAGQ